MSKNYPWLDKTVTIEHGNQKLIVTLRKPESSDDDESWEFKTVSVPSSVETDEPSVDIFDWLMVNTAKPVMDEIFQLALAEVLKE